jgi:hypothetical protein
MIKICYRLFLLEPSNDNSATKVSGAPSNKTTDGGDATNKPSSGANSTDHIHISFDGLKIDHSLKISFSPILFHFRCNNCRRST